MSHEHEHVNMFIPEHVNRFRCEYLNIHLSLSQYQFSDLLSVDFDKNIIGISKTQNSHIYQYISKGERIHM